MDWLGRGKQVYLELEETHIKKELHCECQIKNDEMIPEDLTGITIISISSDYSGSDIMNFLPELLSDSADIEELRIYCRGIRWRDIVSLDLRYIQRLFVNVEGFEISGRLKAKRLRELYVNMTSTTDLSPIEKAIAPIASLDFSEMPFVEKLTLKNFCRLDPKCFSELRFLTYLYISKTDLTDLKWLSGTEYSLKNLCFYGDLNSCEGIEAQTELRKINLSYNSIKSFEQIKMLRKVQYLDIHRNCIEDESYLREMNIPELIISDVDVDIERIKGHIDSILRLAVLHIQYENKQLLDMGSLAPALQKALLRTIAKPFDQRLMEQISSQYSKTLRQLVTCEYRLGRGMTDDDFIKSFNRIAWKEFPFLDFNKQNNL